MRNVRIGLSLFSMAAFVLIASSFAQAQNNRSWVSSTGLDTNACDRANPCRTFQGALAKTNTQGEIDVIDAGDYSNNPPGPLVIAPGKSVTIDGGGIAFITGGNATTFDAVQVTTADPHDVVTLRRLSITGTHYGGFPSPPTNGITFNGKGALVVEKCQISNFQNAGIASTPSTGADLYIRDTDLTNNEFFGVLVTSTTSGLARAFLDNVRIVNNGIFGTGAGVFADSRSQVMISSSAANGNGLHGFGARPTAGTAEINIESSDAVGNNVGIIAGFGGGTATVRISNTDVFDNTGAGIAYNPAGSITSFGNNRIAGNTAGNGPPTASLPQQ